MFQKTTRVSTALLFGLILASCGGEEKANPPANGNSATAVTPDPNTTKTDPTAGVTALDETPTPPETSSSPHAVEKNSSSIDRTTITWTEKLLQAEVEYHNPEYNGQGQFQIEGGKPIAGDLKGTGITNLKALEGMPFQQLDLSDNPITDISPLAGMPLEALYLEGTQVEDLTPLRGAKITDLALSQTPVHTLLGLEGMPIEQLRMVKTNVADLTPLTGAPLAMLWCTDSPVTNIAALRGAPLVSVTLHRTKVLDLTPLAETQLQRLHIAETPVMDLTPLRNLPLTRLVFTPPLISAGLDEIRAITTMQEIGTRFDTPQEKDLTTPDQFWQAMDTVKATGGTGRPNASPQRRRERPVIIPFRRGVLPKPPAPPNFVPKGAPPTAPPTAPPAPPVPTRK